MDVEEEEEIIHNEVVMAEVVEEVVDIAVAVIQDQDLIDHVQDQMIPHIVVMVVVVDVVDVVDIEVVDIEGMEEEVQEEVGMVIKVMYIVDMVVEIKLSSPIANP